MMMVSGIGADHTDKYGKEYLTIDWAAITALVDNPQQVDKAHAQWMIPSTHKSRVFKEQEQHGQYYCLWADLDSMPPPLYDIADHLDSLLIGSDYELYNTSSATVDNQKARVLIPLKNPLPFMDWRMAQQILNDKLEALRIKPDTANERSAQPCYLPNEGKFYGSRSSRYSLFFDPLLIWAIEITAKRDELEAVQAEISKAKQLATEKRAALKLSDAPNLIAAFNLAYTPHEILRDAGYSQRGETFCHPSSETGNYSATVKADSGVLRVNALSSADPLYTDGQGGHDAFSCFTVLCHNGDSSAALKDAGDNLLAIGVVSFNKAVQREHMQKEAAKKAQQTKVKFDVDDLLASQESRNGATQQPLAPLQAQDNYMDDSIDCSSMPPEPPLQIPVSTFNHTLDTEHRYCSVDLLRKIDDDHILKRLCIQVAAETHLPVNTVFLMGLTVFSSIASRKYAVKYQNGEHIPIGLYSVVEQPSGTGKSWCLGTFQKPFIAIQKELLKEVLKKIKDFEKRTGSGEELTDDEQAELKELGQKRKHLSTGLFVTNSTPEALEMTLNRTNGFFSAVSSEQGLFNSLLGNSYKSEKNANNNDVMLNGFDGGHVNSIRVSREGYNGNVIGGVACFAQQGSIEVVLKSSNGTGLSERFLMLAEPHSLGKRDHTKQIQPDPMLSVSYANHCDLMKSVINDPLTLDELNNLFISNEGFLKINQYRNKIEPDLVDGGKFSHVSLRGAASKINMQIMKIAANLHLLNYDLQPEIPERHVIAAIDIANELLEANLKLCKDKGIMGVKAEFTAILSLYENDQRPRTERNIIMSKSQKIPFKDFSGNKSDLIKVTLREMVEQRLLAKTLDATGKALYMLAQ